MPSRASHMPGPLHRIGVVQSTNTVGMHRPNPSHSPANSQFDVKPWSQNVPTGAGRYSQMPPAVSLHVPLYRQLVFGHTRGVPTHVKLPSHADVSVQFSPSLHAVPLARGTSSHDCVALLHVELSVHGPSGHA